MQIGMVGLGKMGGNMTRRLLRDGHEVVVTDRDPSLAEEFRSLGARPAAAIPELVEILSPPRTVWLMVPAGKPVDACIAAAREKLERGDTLVDGGNSFYKDTLRRGDELEASGLSYIDAGTSGGIWGLEEGYCLMVGGSDDAVQRLQPILRSLAPEGGYLHAGRRGAGHYSKMIHNGIEYGLMEAYAEGFELLNASPFEFDMPALCRLWNHGSVIRSWLLDLLGSALSHDPKLSSIAAFVPDSGEGRWTVKEAIDRDIPVPVITSALLRRLRSRQDQPYGAKILAALRAEFGGHSVRKQEQ